MIVDELFAGAYLPYPNYVHLDTGRNTVTVAAMDLQAPARLN